MAESLMALKKKAMKAGMDRDEARAADRSELEAFLSGGGKKKSAPAKKKGKKVAKKNSGSAKKSSAKKRDAAKESAKPTRKSGAKSGKAKPSRKSSSSTGANAVGELDFVNYKEKDWKPRKGSAVYLLFKALQKAKGNVDKAFAALEDDYADFTSAKNRVTGEKRSKGERLEMLRYRLNRTKFEFGVRTGQHKPSSNRVKYGTGDYASGSRKPSGKKSSGSKPSKSKGTTTKKTTGKKRGRPKGSKNKK